jgi:TPR repeat protein
MWRDLDPSEWPEDSGLENKHLIQALFGYAAANEGADGVVTGQSIEEDKRADALPLVVSADSSQHAAIADEGDSYAQSWLGHAYEEGLGVRPSLVESCRWHLAAASKGEIYSQNWLGWAFYYGKGVRRSPKQSLRWNRKTALRGDALGQFNVGIAYSKGSGVERNLRLAAKWWRKAAVQGYVDAQCNLGKAYEDGTGVRRNIAEARSLYRAAAKQGDSIAQFNLARLAMATGPEIRAQAMFKAVLPKLQKAGRQGDSAALLCLGDCATFGWGMKQNTTLGKRRYDEAKSQERIG